MKPLTQLVKDYLESEGFEVLDAMSLEIADNIAVGERDPNALIELYPKLKSSGADTIIVSACVQMPSLQAIPAVEKLSGRPVISAAACTVYAMLKKLNLSARVPNAGGLLSGDH